MTAQMPGRVLEGQKTTGLDPEDEQESGGGKAGGAVRELRKAARLALPVSQREPYGIHTWDQGGD